MSPRPSACSAFAAALFLASVRVSFRPDCGVCPGSDECAVSRRLSIVCHAPRHVCVYRILYRLLACVVHGLPPAHKLSHQCFGRLSTHSLCAELKLERSAWPVQFITWRRKVSPRDRGCVAGCSSTRQRVVARTNRRVFTHLMRIHILHENGSRGQ